MKRWIISFALFFVAGFGLGVAQAHADAGVAVIDAGGSGSGSGVTAPSAALHDPLEQPAAAWDDVKAARKTSWPLAVLAGAILLLRLAAGAAKRFAWLSFLSKGKTAFGIAAGATVAAAAFDVLALGGSWVSVLTAAGAAVFALWKPTAAVKADA